MKQILKPAAVALVFCSLLFSCKKNGGGNDNNLPTPVNNIITPQILDLFKKAGMVINSGTTPPTVNGIYLASPLTCAFDNSGGYSVGQVIDDYKFRFSNQVNSNFTIAVDFKDVSNGATDNGSDGNATYIAGNGNSFTVFASVDGMESGIAYTTLALYSGILQSGNIQNFQEAFYVKSKGPDPSGLVANVGTMRIFSVSDAQLTTTYSIPPSLNRNKASSAMMSTNALRGGNMMGTPNN